MSLPPTYFAVPTLDPTQTVKPFPIPTPGPGEVLIKNVAVAANPKDWKLPKYLRTTGIEGNDVAGYLVQLGEGVAEKEKDRLKVGEKVAALSKMGTSQDKYGAYAEYTVAPASTTFHIPESVSFEDASTLPLAYMTAALDLFGKNGLGLSDKTSSAEPVIVNGAASSVGAYAVQLAKRAGYFVIGIAGSSKDYAKSLGADIVVDYRDYKGADLVTGILNAVGGRQVSYALDAVSQGGTISTLANVLLKTSPDGKGKIATVLPPSEEERKQIPESVFVNFHQVSSAYGEDEELARIYYKKLEDWLVPSSTNPVPLKPNRVKLLPDGLASVRKGLELLENEQVHGEKLVYRIADTPEIRGS